MTDLIEVFDNMLDPVSCHGLINVFENDPDVSSSLIGFSEHGHKNSLRRSAGLTLTPANSGDHYNKLNMALQNAYRAYKMKYPILENVRHVNPEPFNLVRYAGAEEEYGWHVDGADPGLRYRYLSVVCYLNTVAEGGETEFKLQQRMLQPKEGSILIFPSGWTHEHRGLPPVSNPKYIVTCWLRFGDAPLL